MNRLLSAAAAFLVLASVAGPVSAGPDAEKLGKSEGYPACPLVSSIAPPHERCLVGMLSHMDTLVPARRVAKGATVLELKRLPQEAKIAYTYGGRAGDTDSFKLNNRNTGLLVLKGDTIVAERYQYDRKPEHRMQSYSMAKTVVAMLVGIAIAEKRIGSVDDRADQYLAMLKGHPYGEARLKDLLTMSSGVRFREKHDPKDDVSALHKTMLRLEPGGVDSVLPFNERATPPGTKFYYESSESQVLGLVLRAATGQPLAEYLSEKIWQPMGAEADASWLVDGSGHELGYIGINATVRDWGRLGLLLANQGNLNGRQIIPAEWVRAATTVHAPHLAVGAATRHTGYGYQTWLIDNEGRFALLGIRGQAVFVDPKSKVVVVMTAVHAAPEDPARAEQFAYFYGAVQSLADPQ